MPRKTLGELRSQRTFGATDLRSFGHRSRIKQMGYGPEDYAGKPVIAIVNTWSDINQCHAHFKERVADVKRGVQQAGGFPLELPAISLTGVPASAWRRARAICSSAKRSNCSRDSHTSTTRIPSLVFVTQ